MKLVLFDIDGTLLDCDGAGKRSIGEAIKSIFGFDGFPKGYSLAGCTDGQIVNDILLYYNVPQNIIDEKKESVFDAYYNYLKIFTASDEYKKMLLPGILPLLKKLKSLEQKIVLGLLTGNLKKSALLKLKLFDIHNYFLYNGDLFGGFGSDHIKRSELVNICINRAFKMIGKNFYEKDVVVIGDTKNDILCGKHCNVKSIAVATGMYSCDELSKYEPDYLFNDFSDIQKVIDAILS
jgi:phosphoglycolate phosphatase-like HAD superfamily hydrolase